MMKKFLFLLGLISAISSNAQVFYGPTTYLLLNVSSEKCKFYAVSTRSYASLDTEKGAFEVRLRYENNIESKDNDMMVSFKKDYVHADSFPECTINAQIIDYNKIKKDVESTTDVKLKGTFEMNGIKKEILFDAKLHYRPKLIGLEWVFYLPTKDFNLVGPGDLKDCLSTLMQVKGNTHMYDLRQQ